MSGIEILKLALEEGVKVLPKNFMKDNSIKAKCLGYSEKNAMKLEGGGYYVYLIEEDGEFKDKIVYTH